MTTADTVLDSRLKLLLPTEYRETYETIEPKPMGSAGLKYDDSGQVAWDEIWGSFCDLAMAGGKTEVDVTDAGGEGALQRVVGNRGAVQAADARNAACVQEIPVGRQNDVR